MADVKISQLPSGTANASAVVPATNAAGTTTQKITLGAIAALAADQSLNTTSSVTFNSVTLPNYTQIVVGSFDNSTGGANGLGLICAVGYELNWQGGRLKSVYGGTTQTIYVDSPLSLSASGLTFSDGTSLVTDPRKNIAVSPTQLSASANDYAGLTGDIHRMSSSSAVNITGIAAGVSGEAKLLVNVGTFAITLKHQSASSTAANRLIVPWAGDYVMDASGGAALIVYDATDSRWRVV